MSKQAISEEQHVHYAWYEEAKKLPLADLPAFIERLTTEYGHDYGTVCHAVAAAALATANGLAREFGITGFQAGAVMWEFVSHWQRLEGPARLVDYDDLLYPQYEYKFDRTITKSTWEWARGRAHELIAEAQQPMSGKVYEHWQSVAAGKVPFGLGVVDD